MNLQIFQVDAFSNELFKGNPAAVVPLEKWLDTKILQSIAHENNLSETAFFVPNQGRYELRWFTPTKEVELCGHATLASAYVIFELLQAEKNQVAFLTMSGPLWVTKNASLYTMDFPIIPAKQCNLPEVLIDAIGVEPDEVHYCDDYMMVYSHEKIIREINPDIEKLKDIDLRGVIVTAPGSDNVDFVSRFFAPKYGISEDPVTGSAHCMLTPYWSERLNKPKLHGKQLSKRSGNIYCEFDGKRVFISGHAALFMRGEIILPE